MLCIYIQMYVCIFKTPEKSLVHLKEKVQKIFSEYIGMDVCMHAFMSMDVSMYVHVEEQVLYIVLVFHI